MQYTQGTGWREKKKQIQAFQGVNTSCRVDLFSFKYGVAVSKLAASFIQIYLPLKKKKKKICPLDPTTH